METFHKFLTSLVLVLCVKCVVESINAGIYSDNGIDQTEIERSLSLEEKRELELDILNLLGLPNKPRRANSSPSAKSSSKFLLDVYKSLMENDEDEHGRKKRSSDDIQLSGDEQNAIEKSDVIMTIESINHHNNGVRHERGKRLWFNVSEVPISENIVGAELRIFQNKSYSQKKSNATYTVTVYQLIKSLNGEKELELISAVNTSNEFTGWININMTGCLASWVAFPDSNNGLYLSVHPADKSGHEIRPEEIGLITVKGNDESQPFLVVFLKAVNHVKPKRSTRELRSRRVKKSDYTSMMRSAMGQGTVSGGAATGENHSQEGRSCRLSTLYISFKDIKWQDWIIAPTGYAAFYCSGECNFPLNAHMNATNHAIVQTLVALMDPLRYPKPCCAPTKLAPISVLYYLDDDNKNVILKKFKKMAVKSCGCH